MIVMQKYFLKICDVATCKHNILRNVGRKTNTRGIVKVNAGQYVLQKLLIRVQITQSLTYVLDLYLHPLAQQCKEGIFPVIIMIYLIDMNVCETYLRIIIGSKTTAIDKINDLYVIIPRLKRTVIITELFSLKMLFF